jgi:hypothetical protein
MLSSLPRDEALGTQLKHHGKDTGDIMDERDPVFKLFVRLESSTII